MTPPDPLNLFLPPVREWFRTALGEPTPAQRDGWPAIAAGRNTLVLAPTGSGKTLAAFLACLDGLWRQDPVPAGVRVLYVSPLKALNNDIYRNLQVPLAGVALAADRMGYPLPTIDVSVRTGDTPTAERQRFLRRPAHVLITTPESLHLLLTSRAREALRNVTHCIVDEIHALCPNKRGVFLALLLERLQALQPNSFVRIGLSATQRPLAEVARFLAGSDVGHDGTLQLRPVTIVDAGVCKDLDLRVISPVEQFGYLPERSVWPSIYRLLRKEIRENRSTIIFANNRRTVERITANLNGLEAEEQESTEIARAHHGSVALEVRQQTEQALKEGRLPAVVATASLELGIDMGAVELVCQVESPGSVARGLQRVGRAGHLVGRRSKGRLIPKVQGDLLEQAVLAHEMAAGRVEEIHTPVNCLDVLAQQVVAMVAMEDWDVTELYRRVRCAYPFGDLTPHAFETVLEMVSGRYRLSGEGSGRGALAALQPRVSWDRVHNRLVALPGTRALALVNGGTIPDTGQYAAYTVNGLRIGELDEEFIYERRVGDTFLLGTNAWRLERIEADRVIVAPAEGMPALVPFWRGEQAGRSFGLGVAMGRVLRELAGRLDDPECQAWLEQDFFLDPAAARNLRNHVRRQREHAGCLPTDRTLTVEAFRDPLGDWQIVLLSPLGSRLNLALRLALEARLTERLGYRPQCLHHDDGVLIRLADTEEPPLDLLDGLTPENVEPLILRELAESPLFALRFRQNAARALLLPRASPGKRAPLWLQRLRGRDLLQVARRHPDFPIVVETYRECLHDHLDLPRVQQLLADLRDGRVELVTRRADAPSPFAAGLLFAFTAAFMYQEDRTPSNPGRPAELDQQLLQQLVSPQEHGRLLDPRAVHQVEHRLRGVGRPPRSAPEMAEWLRRLGDLAPSDLDGPMAGFIAELEGQGLVRQVRLPRCREPERWVLAEEEAVYRRAFALSESPTARTTTADSGTNATDPASPQEAGETILRRFLETHALVSLAEVLDRYPFDAGWARARLEEWARTGSAVAVQPSPEQAAVQWSAPENFAQVQRQSVALLRREVVTCPPTQFADFIAHWLAVRPAQPRCSASVFEGNGEGPSLPAVLERLEFLLLPASAWEQAVLPARLPRYQPTWLDAEIGAGEWTWVAQRLGETDAVAFVRREQLAHLRAPMLPDAPALGADAERVLESLRVRGACFVTDLARDTGLAPSAVRAGLWTLLRRGLVNNDHFDVIRKGEESVPNGETAVRRSSARRRATVARPEGRWALVPWGHPDAEAHAVFLARLLLHRYGIVARELALTDPWMLPWRVLYEVYSRMELAGEVRRGYFAEGLSGAQFALPEATLRLQDRVLPSTARAPLLLLNSLDPANLYGLGSPLDIPLLDGGTRPLSRRPGNWLVLRAGRPVLIIEQNGKRLTALASASQEEVAEAVHCLPAILDRDAGLAARHKLTVEEWNGQPVAGTAGRALLEGCGFVRDYQAMTLYATWRSGSQP